MTLKIIDNHKKNYLSLSLLLYIRLLHKKNLCSGYRWAAVSIEGMASSSKWSCISSSAMFNPHSASWQGKFIS